jgi:hypothetical protein
LAALLHNMGHGTSGVKGGALQEAAVEVLCVDPSVRSAFMRVGEPCVADRGVASATASPTGFAAPNAKAPVAVTAPAPRVVAAARIPPATTTPRAVAAPGPAVDSASHTLVVPASVANAESKRPDWCYTASAAERRANKACDG